MTERGQNIKKGYNKQGQEQSEFPIVCETCLGDNPYIRMMKQPTGDECRICTRPYTVFRWKAGTKGRFKRTEICQTCAKVKNVCQTCIFDLQYGLPVQVRDKFMGDNKVVLPQSAPNRDWWVQQQTNNMGELALPYNNESLNPILAAQAQRKAQYNRNQAKVCSFWEKGECTRGDLCPYAHEKRYDKESSLAKQNIKDRFHGNKDPLAESILNQIVEKQEKDIVAPEDPTITSIFLKNLPGSINEHELRQIFGQYGVINSVKIIFNQYIAFVNFGSRKSAEIAVKENYGNLIIKGNKVQCTWARSHAYKSQEQKGKLEYDKELQKLNSMIQPSNVPRPENDLPVMQMQELKSKETAQQLASILNPQKLTKEQADKQQQQKQDNNLLDYSDDEKEKKQEKA